MSDGPRAVGLGATDGAAASPWSASQKVMFRIASSYVFLSYVLPLLLALTGLRALYEDRLMSWVGASWFGLSEQRVPIGGCGDRANDYMAVLVNGALALAVAAVWSFFDRQRRGYRGLGYWVMAAVRYYLAFHMLQYGLIKILKSQFPFPAPSTLIRTFGESSPMAVMWAFMGYSTAYCVLIGASEVLGGVLLLSRRTTTAGALVTSGVMANVFFLNVAYDVCVKLMSGHLLAMALGLVALDARRLLDAVVLRRAVPASPVLRATLGRRGSLALLAGKCLLVLAMLAFAFNVAWANWHVAGSAASKPALHGIWEAASAGSELPSPAPSDPASADLVQPDPSRWLLLAIDSETLGAARQRNGTLQTLSLEIDSVNDTIKVSTFGKRRSTSTFHYEQPSPDELVLLDAATGQAARLRRRDASQLPLLRHRVQWMKDLPPEGS